MEHNMILSASGWRKVFAESGDAEDKTELIGNTNTRLAALIGETFAQYMLQKRNSKNTTLLVGTDTRPTGKAIAAAVVKGLVHSGITVHYIGITAAPEIMAYAKSADGFVYISASHNPIGHNGIKFGFSDGGVIPASESNKLIVAFKQKCAETDAESHADEILASVDDAALNIIYEQERIYKREALKAYSEFIKTVISGTEDKDEQQIIFDAIKSSLEKHPLAVVADMNGSARTVSIDNELISSFGITFDPFNNQPGDIVHEIIPEPENLQYCADVINEMQHDGNKNALLGYMPDCDGDRGNIVYWNERVGDDEDEPEAKTIPAQEVFALCVMAESAAEIWKQENATKKSLYKKVISKYGKKAVVVNGPTSMRIDEICSKFGIELFRAEVGEANVVQLAEKKRNEGYSVRILGEGSNGGNITYPSKVRDPLATLFAIIKLLTIRDVQDEFGTLKKGLFHIWCEKSLQEYRYRDDFTLSDILATLPVYETTGVSESRAVLTVRTQDKGLLKENFQKIFTEEWKNHKDELESIYHFDAYEADITNGTEEKRNVTNWNNGNGGLKIRFMNSLDSTQTNAFIWMRPSGTEPVFRVLCDVRGNEYSAERSLLRWEVSMIRKADDLADSSPDSNN